MSAKNYVSERAAKREEAAAERKHLMAELGDLKLAFLLIHNKSAQCRTSAA
jgi:hypothetical protein